MKNDLLNALIHVSLNGPPIHSKEADTLLNEVADKYVSQRHYKVPNIYSQRSDSSSTSTQTHAIDVEMIQDSISYVEVSKLESALDMMTHDEFLNMNLESDDISFEDDEEDDDSNAEPSQ